MNASRPLEAEPDLPPPPERPDCCGGGCAICVLDGYFDEVQRWQKTVEEIHTRHLAAQEAARKSTP